MDTDIVYCDCRDLAAIGHVSGSDDVCCDCRDLAAIGHVSGSGSVSLVVWW